MDLCLLCAMPDTESQNMMRALIDTTRQLIPFKIEINQAGLKDELIQKVKAQPYDVLFLDWQIAEAATPDLVRELNRISSKSRIIVLLPLQIRQYQQYLWGTGVCSCLPKDHLDQEWLCSVLCLIQHSLERERDLKQEKGE